MTKVHLANTAPKWLIKHGFFEKNQWISRLSITLSSGYNYHSSTLTDFIDFSDTFARSNTGHLEIGHKISGGPS